MRRQLIAITLLTAVAQAVAFAKLWLTARLFGTSAELDGYFLALAIPTLPSGVISGALQTAFFLVRARLARDQDRATVERFERAVLLGFGGNAFLNESPLS